MNSKKAFFLTLCCLFSLTIFAQQQSEVIYLKNGSIIKCTVLEQVFGKSVKIKTSDGSIFVFNAEEVLKIEKAGQPSAENTPAGQVGLPKDVDGNEYHFVTIGNQVWMSENMRTTRLADGRRLTLRNESAWWDGLLGRNDERGYAEEDAASYTGVYSTYGAAYLYGYGAAFSGKICPKGWHVPTAEEYRKLLTHPRHYVFEDAPGQVETGVWYGPDAKTATVANPGAAVFFSFDGFRDRHTNRGNISESGYYWADSGSTRAARLVLMPPSEKDFVESASSNYSAMSVRCLRD